MKKSTIFLVQILLFSFAFSSCKEQKIENINILVVVNENIGSDEGEPLNNGIKSLCNYYEDTSCNEFLFVPEVIINRTDFDPEKTEHCEVPLSSLNKFRKSINLLSAVNLIEDYDEQVPKLITSNTLGLKTGKPMEYKLLAAKYPSAKFIKIDDSLTSNIILAKEKLFKELCKNSNNKFIIVLYKDTAVKDITVKDTIDPPPDKYTINIEKGDQLFNKKKYKNSKYFYQLALKFRPNDGYAMERIRLCEEKIKVPPPPPPPDNLKKYKTNFNKGKVEQSKGNYEEAIKYYTEALNFYDDNGEARTEINACEIEIGKRCAPNIKAYLNFDGKSGTMSCIMSPENANYRYTLVISKNENFNSILKSFDLVSNSIFPINKRQKEELLGIKEYANLYFRYYVYCDNVKFESNPVGPLKVSCTTKGDGECKLMR